MNKTISSNPSCQHLHIDNDSARCKACDEMMVSVTVEYETVKSAPNAAGCRNPACLKALNDKNFDHENPPVGCTNPNGVYVPGYPEIQINVAVTQNYRCERCINNGDTVFHSGEQIVWGCGMNHKGDYIPIKEKDNA